MIRLHLFDLDARTVEPRALLDAHEKARAARFRRRRDRDRFETGRAHLRTLLGGALGVEPAAVDLAYGDHGKPRLADPPADAPTFGVAHSDDLLVVALRTREEAALGVDAEWVRPIEAPAEVAARVFTADECEVVVPAAEADDWLPFHRFWTAKEAALKALGTGFSLDPLALRVRPASQDGFTLAPASDAVPGLPERGEWLRVGRGDAPWAGARTAVVAVAPVAPDEPVEIRTPDAR